MLGTSTYKKVNDSFGREVMMEDGTINREALGKLVFSNINARKTLNRIMHPEILKITIIQAIKAWVRGEDVIIVDAPLLFESGFDYLCGKIICVACQENTQIQRLRTRNGYTSEDSSKRIQSQMPLCHKIQLADIVIWNDGNKKDLEEKIKELIKNIQPTRTRCLLERTIPALTIISIIYIIIKRWLKKKGFK